MQLFLIPDLLRCISENVRKVLVTSGSLLLERPIKQGHLHIMLPAQAQLHSHGDCFYVSIQCSYVGAIIHANIKMTKPTQHVNIILVQRHPQMGLYKDALENRY